MAQPNTFREIRGTGYIPSTTQMRDAVQGMLSPRSSADSKFLVYPGSGLPVPFGQFVPRVVQNELNLIANMGFNTIRMYAPFTAWYLDPDDYIKNLVFIRDTCRRRGLKIIFKLWSHQFAPGRKVGSGGNGGTLGLIDIIRNARSSIMPWSAEEVIQALSDGNHMQHGLTKHGAPTGTWFQSGAARDPDYDMANDTYKYAGAPPGESVKRWDRLHGGGMLFSRRSLDSTLVPGPMRLSEMLVRYMEEVADVFHESETLMAYDLCNEPTPKSNDDIMLDFIAYSHNVIDAWHSRHSSRPGWRPEYTVGLSSAKHINDVYQNLWGRYKIAMSFVSLHEWGALLYDQKPVSKTLLAQYDLAARSMPLRPPWKAMEVVCSEFYGQGLFGHNQDNLGRILSTLGQMQWGGVIWNFIEYNAFQRFNSSGNAWEDPVDGFIVPADPPNGVRHTGAIPAPLFNNQVWRKDAWDLLRWLS